MSALGMAMGLVWVRSCFFFEPNPPIKFENSDSTQNHDGLYFFDPNPRRLLGQNPFKTRRDMESYVLSFGENRVLNKNIRNINTPT